MAILLLKFGVHLVDDFRAQTEPATSGDRLQAIANLVGSAIGALLSGALAVGAAVWVLGRERAERVEQARLADERQVREMKLTAMSLFNWLSSQCIKVLTTLSAVESVAKKKVPPQWVAMMMKVHSRDIANKHPPTELLVRIRDHYPVILVALDSLVVQFEVISGALISGTVIEPTDIHPNPPALEPTASWAISVVHPCRSLFWHLDRVAEGCSDVANLVADLKKNLEQRLVEIEKWAISQGHKPIDFTEIFEPGNPPLDAGG